MKDPFATLGLEARFDLDVSEIERRYRELQKALHPDRHVGKPAGERRIALGKAVEVNEAYRALRDDLGRAKALLALRGIEAKDERPADPAFLMDVMERREALGEARLKGDVGRARSLAVVARADYERAKSEIAQLFAGGAELSAIADLLSRMRYYRRFLDEVDAIEEDAANPS